MRSPKLISGLLTLAAGILLSLITAAGRCPAHAFTPSGTQDAAAGQAAQKPEVRYIEPDVEIERELAGGGEHHYRIVLGVGQHVSFQIVKQGINVALTLKVPNGENTFIANFENREQGGETLSLVAHTAGPHTLVVRPESENCPSGRYRVKLYELREATEQDRRRFDAQQAVVEADRLFKQETDEARREALKKLSASLLVWQSVGDRIWEARTLYRIGYLYYWLNEYKAALESLNRVVELRRATGDPAGEAEALALIGSVYTYMEESQKAIESLNQAVILQQPLSERWQSAVTFLELGRVNDKLGESEKASYYYTQALQLYRELGDRNDAATSLVNLSMLQVTLGEFQPALDNAQAALALYRAEKIRYGEAAALHHLGVVYDNLGELQQALYHHNQSLSIFRDLKDPFSEAYVLANMGTVYSALGDQQTAIDYYNKALPLMRAVMNRRGEAGTLRRVGDVYRKTGDLPKALEHLNQSLRLTRELSAPLDEAEALTFIGEVYAAMGDHLQAHEHLTRALSLRRALADRRGEAATLYARAAAERDQGKLHEARADAEAAIKIIESLRAKVTGVELRTSYFAAQQRYYELYIDLLMRLHEQSPASGHDAQALQASERARARALLESLAEARADIRQGIDQTLLEQERSLQRRLNAKEERRVRLLSGKHTSEQAEAANREVSALLDEYQQTQARIRAASPRYAALTQPRPFDLKEIQAQLDDETLLLVYSLGGKRSFLWAVTPATVKSYVLPKRDEIEDAARQVYKLLQVSNRRASMTQAQGETNQLSRQLLNPVAGQLTGKRLVIVADGALQYVPFAALTAPGGKQPLIAEHEVVNLPSISVLGQQRRELMGRSPASKTVVAIADPVFEAQDERFRTRATQVRRGVSAASEQADPLAAVTRSAEDAGLTSFRRLRYSRDEADQITGLVPPATRSKIVDFDASRAGLARTDLSQYRILHFATHSLLNSKNPELSGIVLSLYDERGQPQDGFLRAHEIYNLKLGADLVVLSACQTALGKEVRGEGLIGLTRGFMYAGAPRVVVSLWDVDDAATAELMKRFYRGMIRENLRPAAALRAAQAAMAEDSRWSAPYYWAGFVLQGEWR